MRTNSFGQPVGPALDWSARARPARTPMVGAACRLEPLDPDRHAEPLLRAYGEAPDARAFTYLSTEAPTDLPSWRDELAVRSASDDPLHFAIRVADDILGTAAFMRIDPANGVIEIGHIAFAPRLQRTRAGTEAIFAMMVRAFDELGYRRLEWKCDSLNEPSRRAALRYGFVFEGIFRKAVVTKGRSRDTAWYSITDDEWPEVKAALGAWLAPDNFDAAGRQKTALRRATIT